MKNALLVYHTIFGVSMSCQRTFCFRIKIREIVGHVVATINNAATVFVINCFQ